VALLTRLIVMITIVVGLTDLIEYHHLKQNPSHLTLEYTILTIIITIVPIIVILSYWHRRKWL
jgi:hypothetical protein